MTTTDKSAKRQLEKLGRQTRNEREEALWQENLDNANKPPARVDEDELAALLADLSL